MPRSAATTSAGAAAPGATRINSTRLEGFRTRLRGVVQARRIELPLDHAASQQLRDGRYPAIDRIGQIAEPDGERPDFAAGDATRNRGPEPDDDLAAERVGAAGGDGQQASGAALPCRDEGGGIALRFQLTERGQRLELTSGPLVDCR